MTQSDKNRRRRSKVLALIGSSTAILLGVLSATAQATPGQPDPSFGIGGLFVHEFARANFDSGSEFRAIALAPDGAVDADGVADTEDDREVLIARLTEQGAFDPSFSSGAGLVTVFYPQTEHQISLQSADAEYVYPDGSILAGGNRELGRVTPSGQVDPGFEHENVDRIDIGALTVQPSGQIVTVGSTESPEPNGPEPPVAEGLLPNGAPDPSFGKGGLVSLPLHPGTDSREMTEDVESLPAGKTLLAGYGTSSETERYVWMARLNANGSLDSSFASGGFVYEPSSEGDVALAREPNGRIVLFGERRTETPGPRSEPHGWQTVAWGFTEQGAPDPSFGQGGVMSLSSSQPELSNFVSSATSDASGRLYVAVNQVKLDDYAGAPFIARLSPTGQLDAGYGQSGLAVGPESAHFAALSVDGLGRVTAAGTGVGGSLIERFQGDTQPTTGSTPAASKPKTGPAQSSTRTRLLITCHATSKRRLRCTLRIKDLHGKWSTIEASVTRHSKRIAYLSRRRLKLPAQLQLSLPAHASRQTYVVTIKLRRARHLERLSAKLVLSSKR